MKVYLLTSEAWDDKDDDALIAPWYAPTTKEKQA